MALDHESSGRSRGRVQPNGASPTHPDWCSRGWTAYRSFRLHAARLIPPAADMAKAVIGQQIRR